MMRVCLLIAIASISQAFAELVPVNELGLRIAPGFEITRSVSYTHLTLPTKA